MAILLNLYEWLLTRSSEEEGQGLVEYALIIVLVSVAAIAMMTLLGDQIAAVFQYITGQLAV